MVSEGSRSAWNSVLCLPGTIMVETSDGLSYVLSIVEEMEKAGVAIVRAFRGRLRLQTM